MARKFSILLIDDDRELGPILKRASKDVFPEADYVQVFSCKEAQTYFEKLDTYGPKLILLDLDMSSTSGLAFLAYLKKGPLKAESIPVIMLTVSELPADIFNAYQFGAAAFTTKPFSYSEWKDYLKVLRGYWQDTVSTEPVRFYPKSYIIPAALPLLI